MKLKNSIREACLVEQTDDQYCYLIDVTQNAINIFGEIVVRAELKMSGSYINKKYYIDRIEEDVIAEIDTIRDNPNSLSFDSSNSLIIEFVGGNKVIFSSSEYGNLKQLASR